MYIWNCINTYIHAYMYTCTHATIHTHVHMHTHTHMHTNTDKHTYIQKYMHIYSQTWYGQWFVWLEITKYSKNQIWSLTVVILFRCTHLHWGTYPLYVILSFYTQQSYSLRQPPRHLASHIKVHPTELLLATLWVCYCTANRAWLMVCTIFHVLPLQHYPSLASAVVGGDGVGAVYVLPL